MRFIESGYPSPDWVSMRQEIDISMELPTAEFLCRDFEDLSPLDVPTAEEPCHSLDSQVPLNSSDEFVTAINFLEQVLFEDEERQVEKRQRHFKLEDKHNGAIEASIETSRNNLMPHSLAHKSSFAYQKPHPLSNLEEQYNRAIEASLFALQKRKLTILCGRADELSHSLDSQVHFKLEDKHNGAIEASIETSRNNLMPPSLAHKSSFGNQKLQPVSKLEEQYNRAIEASLYALQQSKLTIICGMSQQAEAPIVRLVNKTDDN